MSLISGEPKTSTKVWALLGFGAFFLVGALLPSTTRKKSRRRRKGPRVTKRRDARTGRRNVRYWDGKPYTQESYHNTKRDAERRVGQLRKSGRSARTVSGRIRGTTTSLWVVYVR